ncbi:MAG: NAD(P)H-binding protein [Actinobacteria bacterium]|nr:NAD(P)H-binding protein [Actinomycetota bacterium]
MPVLITAAETAVGQALVHRIAATGGEVRAYCGPDAPLALLRQAGAVCASGSLLDEGHLETAMEQVHTVVHFAVRLDVDIPEQLLEETATVVAAAVGAGVRRLIAVSLPGPDPNAPDRVRTVAGEAEAVVEAVDFPSVIVRPSLVDTGELRATLVRTPLGRSALDNAVAPVAVEDLVDLLAALDERRDLVGDRHIVVAADGPEVVPLGDYLRRVGITPLSLAARTATRLRSGGNETLQEALGGPWTSAPDVSDAWALAGITPRSPLATTSPPP